MAKFPFFSTKALSKFSLKISPILKNRAVLYFLLLLAIIDSVVFATKGDNMSIVVLLLVGFLTTFFSKNMIVVLAIALCATHLFKYGIKNAMEGFKEGADGDDEDNIMDDMPSADEDPTEMEIPDMTGADTDEIINDAKATTDKLVASKEAKVKDLEKELGDLQTSQKNILTGITELESFLNRAEGFMQKYEKYAKKPE